MSAERDAGLTALQKGDIAAAIATLEVVTQRDASDYQAYLYLGAAYGQAGRHTEAVTTLTQAVQLQPSNPQARYNLGVAYERAGWTNEALIAMQQALTLQPNYPQAQEAMNRIQATIAPPATATQPMQPAAPNYAPAAQPAYTQAAQPNYPPPAQAPGYAAPGTPPYGQPQPGAYPVQAPPYGAVPQAPYGVPGQQPPMGYGASQAPQYAQRPLSAAHDTEPNMGAGWLLTIVMTLVCGMASVVYTLLAGRYMPWPSILFGFLFGFAIPKVVGETGERQGVMAAVGAGLSTLMAFGLPCLLGATFNPVGLALVALAMWRGYRIAAGNS